ncbi:MAG: YqaJ viral recombinase family protein [bacterium]|nr:YqaJ viral recombinase family protein [bacterium]
MAEVHLIQGSPAWKAFRLTGIGASESAAILGVSPWASRSEIIARKRGELAEQESNAAMAKGVLAEEPIRRKLEKMLGSPIFPCVFKSDKYPFLFASLDGLTLSNLVVEIKTCNQSVYDRARMGIIPLGYSVQIQQQLLCSERPTAVIAFARYADDEPVLVYQKPDLDLQQRIIEEGAKAWLEVKTGSPLAEAQPTEVPPELNNLLKEYDYVESKYREWKAKYDALSAAIKEVANGKSYTTPSFRIVLQPRATVGYRQACIDAEIDVTAYTKTTISIQIKRVNEEQDDVDQNS